MTDPHSERDWQRLFAASAPPAVDPGLTLRVLAALPPARRRRERQRIRVLLLPALVATVVMSATVVPGMADPARLLGSLIISAGLASLAFWSVLTVAD